MLDVPIRKGGKLSGVICFEHLERPVSWTQEEKEFAASLADLISAKFESVERLKAEKERKATEERYKNVLEYALIGIYHSTPSGQLLFVNRAMRSILEIETHDDLSSIKIEEFYKNPDNRNILLDRLEKDNVLRDFEVELKSLKNNPRTVLINAYKEDHQIVGMMMDITIQKGALKALNEALSKAEESDRLKTSLLANMNHELRTPMNAILGFSELMLSESEDPEAIFYSKKIHNAGKRLMNTLQAILELADLETSKARLIIRDIELKNILNEVIFPFLGMATEKGLYLVTEFTNKICVRADENLLRLVFRNLLDNAVKFTEEGGITIETQVKETDRSTWALIS